MKKILKVFKFGGASLRDAERIRNVGNILKDYVADQLVIVVSAMGKVTDKMEKVVQAHADQTGDASALLEEVKQQHYQLCGELFEGPHEVYDLINDLFVEVEWILEEEPHENYDYMYDQMVSIGELVSSRIVHAYLNTIDLPSQWLDARDVILTDNIFREGWVQWEETEERAERTVKPMLEKNEFIVTQGFIASTSENFTTTLGREGSDYTAAIFSFCLDAESMTIWKDVPGVLTGDPRLFENVTKLDRLSYKEAIEMTYYGAKVIHPKTIKPLQNKNIPLYVKSFIDPTGDGTYISDEVDDTYPPMVAVEQDQALVMISTRDFSFVAEHHISYIFQLIAEFRLQVNMMQNTAISFVLCMNDIDDKVDRFAEKLQDQFKVLIDRELELITVRHYQQPLLETLKEGRMVLLEERIRKTVQMVVKKVPIMKRK
ncbi:MAG: aspartate kinase [Saprospiraceae bacterium]|nr:aspartate kinase [Lewinella sp.]